MISLHDGALVGWVVVGLGLAACQGTGETEATATFSDCLARNGIVAESVEVTLRDGAIGSIDVVILSEGDVPYEPSVRLACTEEVENQ
jgi:hypothetical protein